jgi:DNA repair protein RadC
MAITDWPANERPREKLLAQGATALSDAELLAIFLRVGVKGKSAVDLARDLLNTFGSLNGIFSADLSKIQQVHGMGESKYCQLQAIFEMSRRALSEEMREGDTLNSPQKVRDYLTLALSHLRVEVFMGLFVDTQNRIVAHEILFEGTLTHTSVYPREIVRRALHHNAAAVILAHNHPSGVTTPSASDISITQTLKQSLDLIEVRVLDHFIVAGNQMASFVELGLLS